MSKRSASEVDSTETDTAMLDGYTDSMRSTILAKISTDAQKADACALLSTLDPRSTIVREAFLTSEFCTRQFYPCLVSMDLNVVLEAANTVKTWLNSASEDPSVETLRRLYALQLMPVLMESVQRSLILLEGFLTADENGRKAIVEIFESLLISLLILGENLEVSLEQINKHGSAIKLITGIYEKRQFLPDELLCTAAECLSVLTEENEGFAESAEGIHLYTVLLNLPHDWTATKALPYTIKSLMAISTLHGNPKDQVYEKCLDRLCSTLTFQNADVSMLAATLETLANVMEGLDQSQLANEDYQLIMRMLEQVCKVLSASDDITVIGRGLGALVNLLVLCVGQLGENICQMIWNEAAGNWMPKCADNEEAVSGLLSVLRILYLNMAEGTATLSPNQLQLLVNAVKGHKSLLQSAMMVIIPLSVKAESAPESLDQIIHDVIPLLGKADPEDLEDLVALLDECLGESVDPLPIRLQALIQEE